MNLASNEFSKQVNGFNFKPYVKRALEARGEDTVTPYSSMEMGEDHYGFCNRSSTDSEAT